MVPLLPFLLLVPTGLYMFFLPYVRKSQGGRHTSSEA